MTQAVPTNTEANEVIDHAAEMTGDAGASHAVAEVGHEPAAQVSGVEAFFAEPSNAVMLAFVLFFVLLGKKLFGFTFSALDHRSHRIKNELEHAQKLREEAEEILASYRKKHAECLQEAEEILANARKHADLLVTQAEQELKEILASRQSMAEAKILQAEKQAMDEIRDHIVDITISAAKTIIIENINETSGDELVQRAIADIERKVH